MKRVKPCCLRPCRYCDCCSSCVFCFCLANEPDCSPSSSQVNTTLQEFSMLPVQSLKRNEIAGLDLAGIPVNDFHASLLSAFVGAQSSLLVPHHFRVCSCNRGRLFVARCVMQSPRCIFHGSTGLEPLKMWGGYPWDVGVGPRFGTALVLCGDCVFGWQSHRMGWHCGASSCGPSASEPTNRALGATVANP